MIGFRFRINDLPEQPGEPKIPIHRLFLPFGLIFLVLGIVGLHNYFQLKGPPLSQLHEIKLLSFTNVVAEGEIPGSTHIDSIWLQSSNGLKIRYREKFPYSSEILNLNTNYGLLLDSTNAIWGITTANGEVLARSYFEEINI
jgi:hypothetical protein